MEFGLILGLIMVNLLVLAKYDHWHGGGCWGPRLLLSITPFIILPLGSLLEAIPRQRGLNSLLVPLLTITMVVQIPGLSLNYGRFLQKVYDLSVEQFYHRVTFEIAYSPLIGQWVELSQVINNLREPAQRAIISQIAFQNSGDPSRAIQVLSANLPDFWFIYLGFIWSYL